MDKQKILEITGAIQNNKKMLWFICILLCFVFCFVMFSGQSDNRSTISEIIRDNEQARHNIQDASKQLDVIEQGIGNSAGRIEASKNRIDQSAGRIDSIIDSNKGSQELIAESIALSREARSILEGLRETDTKSN